MPPEVDPAAPPTAISSAARSEHVVPNVIQTTQFIAKVTAIVILVATVLLTGLLLLQGFEPARATLQALWSWLPEPFPKTPKESATTINPKPPKRCIMKRNVL